MKRDTEQTLNRTKAVFKNITLKKGAAVRNHKGFYKLWGYVFLRFSAMCARDISLQAQALDESLEAHVDFEMNEEHEEIVLKEVDCSTELRDSLRRKYKYSVGDLRLTKSEADLLNSLDDKRTKETFNQLGIEYPLPVPEEMKDYCKPIPK